MGVCPISFPSSPGGTFEPSNYTITRSKGGSLLVTANGTALYAYDRNIRHIDFSETIDTLVPVGSGGTLNVDDPTTEIGDAPEEEEGEFTIPEIHVSGT